MDRKDFSRSKKILFHVLFWAGYLLLNDLAWFSFDRNYLYSSYFGILFLPVKIAVVYINFYWLIPKLLLKRKIIFFLFSLMFIFFIAGIIQQIILNLFSVIPKNELVPLLSGKNLVLIIIQHIIPINSIVFFTSMVSLLQQWYFLQIKSDKLAKENLHAELNYLKGQIQPHFLFNTLNNLYSLTLHQSPSAPKIVLKLSEILSYMLYNTSENENLLTKEVEHITNYIELEKMRFGNRLELSLNISGKLSGQTIEPLILMTFIENSFKHGASKALNQVWITIDLKLKDNILCFKVENNKTDFLYTGKPNGNGIGLINVKRRLDILYPGSYILNIENEKERFAIDLKLNLKKMHLYEKY